MQERHDFELTFPSAFERARRAASQIVGNGPAAEDAAAEAMARAYSRWDTLATSPTRDAWIARVAMNLAIDSVKRSRVSVSHLFRRSHEEPLTTRLVVGAALARLPRRQREVVALCWLAEFSEAEAAAALGVSAGTVKQHLHRGMAALRAQHLDADIGRPEVAHANP